VNPTNGTKCDIIKERVAAQEEQKEAFYETQKVHSTQTKSHLNPPAKGGYYYGSIHKLQI
jgi:hypothetical protein